MHQIEMLCVNSLQKLANHGPWQHASRSQGMNDAPRKWWNGLDAAVKNMGLCPARADRCTYVSYSDVKKHKKTHMVHSIDANEDTPRRLSVIPHLLLMRIPIQGCVIMENEVMQFYPWPMFVGGGTSSVPSSLPRNFPRS